MKRLVIGLVLVAITVGLTGSGAQATFTKKAVFEASITVGTFPTTTSMTLTATAMVGPPTTAIMLAEPVPPLPGLPTSTTTTTTVASTTTTTLAQVPPPVPVVPTTTTSTTVPSTTTTEASTTTSPPTTTTTTTTTVPTKSGRAVPVYPS